MKVEDCDGGSDECRIDGNGPMDRWLLLEFDMAVLSKKCSGNRQTYPQCLGLVISVIVVVWMGCESGCQDGYSDCLTLFISNLQFGF